MATECEKKEQRGIAEIAADASFQAAHKKGAAPMNAKVCRYG